MRQDSNALPLSPALLQAASSMHVLIVDGNQAIRHYIRQALEEAHYQVLEASDGADALTILCLLQERIVALIGAELPDMDAGRLLTAILASPDLQAAGHGYLLMADATFVLLLATHHAVQVLDVPLLSRPPRLQDLYHAVARAVVRMVAPRAALYSDDAPWR